MDHQVHQKLRGAATSPGRARTDVSTLQIVMSSMIVFARVQLVLGGCRSNHLHTGWSRSPSSGGPPTHHRREQENEIHAAATIHVTTVTLLCCNFIIRQVPLLLDYNWPNGSRWLSYSLHLSMGYNDLVTVSRSATIEAFKRRKREITLDFIVLRYNSGVKLLAPPQFD